MSDQTPTTEGSIFTQGEATVQTTEDKAVTPDQGVKQNQPDIDAVFKDQLSAIVDDSGEQKYKDPFTALEALKHSQAHIKTLQEENKTLRENKTENDTLKQALQNISAKQEPKDETKSEGVNAEQVKGMTYEAIQQYEQAKAQESNMKTVSDALVSQYGGDVEKAKTAFQAKAQELGMDTSMLETLAATSPKAALAYFNTSKDAFQTTQGSVNTQALQQDKKEPVDYTARFLKSSNPAISKWHDAGLDLNSKDN